MVSSGYAGLRRESGLEQIAVISDAHGNLTALEAVLNDISLHGVRRIICLGDLVGKGPRSREVLERCLAVGEAFVMGNWDDFVSREDFQPSVAWHRDQIGAEGLSALRKFTGQLTFYLSGRLVRLFHASPDTLFHKVYYNAPSEEKKAMFMPPVLDGEVSLPDDSDIVGYGDIHHGYVESFQEQTLFNCGSVGDPLDIPEASSAILEGNYDTREKGPFSIRFCRVPYDIEAEIQAAKDSGMPYLSSYANELRTAHYSRY